MSKVAIVYWSGTGNTEMMASHIETGAKASGAEVSVYKAEDFSEDLFDNYDAIAFGCPSMGTDELEDTVFQPMFDSIKSKLKDKRIALFGSYGWGDGEWMRNWEDDCKAAGAYLVAAPVICMEEPDEEATEACEELGRALNV